MPHWLTCPLPAGCGRSTAQPPGRRKKRRWAAMMFLEESPSRKFSKSQTLMDSAERKGEEQRRLLITENESEDNPELERKRQRKRKRKRGKKPRRGRGKEEAATQEREREIALPFWIKSCANTNATTTESNARSAAWPPHLRSPPQHRCSASCRALSSAKHESISRPLYRVASLTTSRYLLSGVFAAWRRGGGAAGPRLSHAPGSTCALSSCPATRARQPPYLPGLARPAPKTHHLPHTAGVFRPTPLGHATPTWPSPEFSLYCLSPRLLIRLPCRGVTRILSCDYSSLNTLRIPDSAVWLTRGSIPP